jgi:hypothetical protein
MELISVRREGVAPARVRVTAAVVYDDRPGTVEEYWFEFPAPLADSLSDSGNAWLVCLAPMAATLGEPLRLSLPVDPFLVANVAAVMGIWKSWYPRLHVAPIVASAESAPAFGRRRTAVFFSGGVDSFFTLLRNEQRQAEDVPADDLIAIHGFDILLESEDAFDRHRRRLERVAAETGKTLVPVRMNLRRTRLRELSMGGLWHGCALASIGLLMEKRYDRLLIPASEDVPNLGPWGSHPVTDPLLSSSTTTVIHDGTAFARWDKLEFLANFDVALRSLRVCSRDTSENCGACEKCYRNMIILDALNLLGRSTTFPAKTLDLEKVSCIFVRGWRDVFYDDLRRFVISRGRPDIARAIDRSIRRSRWRGPVVKAAKRISRLRYGGRFGRWLQKWALADRLR